MTNPTNQVSGESLDFLAADEAFEEKYKVDSRDPSAAPELSIFRDGWLAALAAQPAAPAEVVATVWQIDDEHGGIAWQTSAPTEAHAASIARRNGKVTPLAPVAALRTPAQAPSTGAVKCTRCAGSGVVDDGYITGSGGVDYENGPVKCVKDCPAGNGTGAPPVVQPASPAVEVASLSDAELADHVEVIAAGFSMPEYPQVHRNTMRGRLIEAARRLRAAPAVAVPGSLTDQQRQALIDMLNEQHMTAVYHCLRVWEAWSVGTMSEDDFQPASESDMAAEIVDAILSALATTSTAAQPESGVKP